jgi:hypothetical protein
VEAAAGYPDALLPTSKGGPVDDWFERVKQLKRSEGIASLDVPGPQDRSHNFPML